MNQYISVSFKVGLTTPIKNTYKKVMTKDKKSAFIKIKVDVLMDKVNILIKGESLYRLVEAVKEGEEWVVEIDSSWISKNELWEAFVYGSIGEKSYDIGVITFNVEVSEVDSISGDVQEYYIQSIEEVSDEFKKYINELKQSVNSELFDFDSVQKRLTELELKEDKDTIYLKPSSEPISYIQGLEDELSSIKSKNTEQDNSLASMELKKLDKEQEKWITPTLLNGWTGSIKFRKNNMGQLEFLGTAYNAVDKKLKMFDLPESHALSILSGLSPESIKRITATYARAGSNLSVATFIVIKNRTEVFITSETTLNGTHFINAVMGII